MVQTRRQDYQTPAYLGLDRDLLELLALTNGDGASLDPAQVTRFPAGEGPYSALVLAPGTPATFTYAASTVQAIAVRGIWGWHDAWPEAWRSSGDTLQATVDEDAALLSVAEVTGTDGLGLAPRFQVGQLLRLGEEYAHVVAVDAEADTLSVIRGVRGTAGGSPRGGHGDRSLRPAGGRAGALPALGGLALPAGRRRDRGRGGLALPARSARRPPAPRRAPALPARGLAARGATRRVLSAEFQVLSWGR